MTTTLPAIPGLVRQGTPCARKHWNIIKTEHVIRYGLVFGRWCPASGVAQVLNLSNGVGLTEVAPDDLLVVLDDPTGFDHAARYVAETICKKAGWPAPVSVMACHQRGLLVGLWLSLAFEGTTDARQIFCFTRENGGDRLMDKQFCGGIPTYCTTVVDVAKVETAVEALRLAVLAVAGVQV
jgi:hypothetical protein